MTKELLFRANDLQDCISSNWNSLERQQEAIKKLKKMPKREDGTISVDLPEIGYVRILVEDIIKIEEQRCEMLKELIDKHQKEFDEL